SRRARGYRCPASAPARAGRVSSHVLGPGLWRHSPVEWLRPRGAGAIPCGPSWRDTGLAHSADSPRQLVPQIAARLTSGDRLRTHASALRASEETRPALQRGWTATGPFTSTLPRDLLARDEDLPPVRAAPELPLAAVAAGLAAGGAPRLLHPRSRGAARSVAHLRVLRARGARLPAPSPTDDDGAALVRVLRGRAVVAEDRAQDARGRGVPGDRGRPAPGPHLRERVPAHPPRGVRG